MARLITTLLIILGLGGAGYAGVKYQAAPPAPVPKAETIKEAWIQVVKGTVYSKVPGQAIELKSGDVVAAGSTIETSKNSEAIIHFPDGSQLRLDKETTISVSDILFTTADNSLIVRLGLTVGRVWSKVVTLATPESSWEVKTSNAVATVRGTAFGMGYKSGTSWVLGSENAIYVAPLDPETKEKILRAEVILNEKRSVQVSDKDAKFASATTSTSTISIKIRDGETDPLAKDSWIRAQKELDKKFDIKINELKAKTDSAVKVRDELRTENTKAKENFRKEEVNAEEEHADTVTPPAARPPSSSPTPSSSQSTGGGGSGSSIDTEGVITVVTESTLDNVLEGETIRFRAILSNNSGKQDVTATVKWSIIGGIGSITAPGVFLAKLGEEVSEAGESVGYVVAGFTSRKEVSKSDLIKVKAKLSDSSLDIGGQ